jgi:hypothetical protein
MTRSVLVLSALLMVSGVAFAGPRVEQSQPAPAPDSPCVDAFGGRPPAFPIKGWKTNFCRRSVELSEIMSGGPPRDGIPPIDSPTFVSQKDADGWVSKREPVIALEIGGQAKAYPLQVLIWHEIVNDELGGVPVAVTFCPLCYAAITFERPTVNGRVLTFGTTGSLRNSDMVMWDRQTETWWQQFTGEGIVGVLTGTKLVQRPASILGYEQFKVLYPQGTVLSRDTGHDRAYGANPYVGYDDIERTPMLYRGAVGPELPAMAHVVGLLRDGGKRAYSLADLSARGVINDTIGDEPVALFWSAGSRSALDSGAIPSSRDIGATAVFDRRVDGRALTFEPTEGGFKDRSTGTTWSLSGVAVTGKFAGRHLEQLPHHDIFWFVWSAFAHDGELYAPPESE